MLHKLPISKYGEYSCAAYNELNYQKEGEQDQEWLFWNAEKRQINDFWKLPSFNECCGLELAYDHFSSINLPTIYAFKNEQEQVSDG
jgi:hypothetical protein